MPTLGFTDNDGVDIGNKYVTKEYLSNNYAVLIPSITTAAALFTGQNTYGELGDNSTVDKSSPNTVVGGGTWKKISAGNFGTTSGIKTNGVLWSWGNNSYGQLGNNSTVNRSSPVTAIGTNSEWVDIGVGTDSALAVKSDGSLWTWGNNGSGQLGTNNAINRSSPGTTVGAGNDWMKVAANVDNYYAIKTTGLIYSWGNNYGGALGLGDTINRSSPVTVVGTSTTTPWIKVAAGYYSAAAIKTDGTLWTWGANYGGQLADGTTVNKSSPVTVAGGGTTWKEIAAGRTHMLAVKTDGTLWSWGNPTYGQLGINNAGTARSSPGTVAGGGTTWSTVYCGFYQSAAIKTDGSLWVWGQNVHGAIGDGTTIARSSPNTVNNLPGNSWKSVAFGTIGSIMAVIQEEGDW